MVLVQCVIHTFQHIAHHIRLLRRVSPYEQVEVHARVAHLRNHALHLLALVHPLVMQVVQGILHHCGHLLQVRAVGYTKGHDCQHVAMVTRQVLIVLGKQLCVLESDHLAVERLHHR